MQEATRVQATLQINTTSNFHSSAAEEGHRLLKMCILEKESPWLMRLAMVLLGGELVIEWIYSVATLNNVPSYILPANIILPILIYI